MKGKFHFLGFWILFFLGLDHFRGEQHVWLLLVGPSIPWQQVSMIVEKEFAGGSSLFDPHTVVKVPVMVFPFRA